MNIIAPNCSNTCSNNTKNIVCIINSVFHQDNYNTFLCLNNRKSNSFYYISDNEVYEKHIEVAELMGFKPIGCSQQTGPSCRLIIEGLVKIRGTIIGNMSRSGEHSNDWYMFAEVANKQQNLVKTVSKYAAYHCFMNCSTCPEVDSVLRRYLVNIIKAKSLTNIDNNTSTKVTKKDKLEVGKLIDSISDVGANVGNLVKDQRERWAVVKEKEELSEYQQIKIVNNSTSRNGDGYYYQKLIKRINNKHKGANKSGCNQCW
jgi:hypothetical protein